MQINPSFQREKINVTQTLRELTEKKKDLRERVLNSVTIFHIKPKVIFNAVCVNSSEINFYFFI